MINEKYSFSVEDIKIISENPESKFAVLELDFFASGDSLNNTYVSEETLIKTAETIKLCPLVWKLDERLQDSYTHDPLESPCGFVPETSTIQTKVLPDGRKMLSVMAYLWKRYTGDLVSFFKRDGGQKPVSVEMIVYKTRIMKDSRTELLDFRYEGITILGTFVTPAIPNAGARVLSFSKIEEEYMQDIEEEFSTEIPYKRIEDISPSLKGVFPKLTLAQANEIARQAKFEERGENELDIFISLFKKSHRVVNGAWEKKEMEHMSTKKEENLGLSEPEKEEKSMALKDTEEKVIENSEEEKKAPEEKTEPFAGDESPKEDDKTAKGEPKEDNKKFEFPKTMTPESMSAFFANDDDEDDEDVKMAKVEMAKGLEFANPALVMSGMFSKMCKMAKVIEKMAKESEVYMEENKALKEFKTQVEESQKLFSIEKTFAELEQRVIIPQEAKDEMLAEAEKYTFQELDQWKIYCKSKSFDFVTRVSSEEDTEKIGLPHTTGETKSKSGLWD